MIRQESEDLQNEVDEHANEHEIEHENEHENVDGDEKVFPLILGEFPWQKIREKFARYLRE